MSSVYRQATRALLLFAVHTLASGAACEDSSAPDAARAVGYVPDGLGLIACKPLPTDPTRKIVAFVREIGTHEYSLVVLIAATASGEVLSKFIEERAPFSGSGDPDKLTIDTAKYLLAPGTRAFGIRVRYSLNSWDQSEDLSLFVAHPDRLERVLSDMSVKFSYARGCPFDRTDMARRIVIASSASNGFYDLVVRTNWATYEALSGPRHDCVYSRFPSRENSSARVKFVDGSYLVPPDLR